MSLLIVENGTVVENANSYIDIDFADAYLDLTDKEDWNNYNTTQKEKAIIEATQAIDLSYVFSGEVVNTEQTLEFPRKNCYDKQRDVFLPTSIIPVNLKNAVAELAYLRLTSGESLIVAVDSEVLKKEKIGNIEIERFDKTKITENEKFKKVTSMIERYTKQISKAIFSERG